MASTRNMKGIVGYRPASKSVVIARRLLRKARLEAAEKRGPKATYRPTKSSKPKR